MTIIESLISSLRTMHVANINLANEAADTIERQQREIEALKEELIKVNYAYALLESIA